MSTNLESTKGIKKHEALSGFDIHQKPSSNVDYFGINELKNQLFVQFKGGTGAYIYGEVPVEILEQAKAAESIGKFISANIVGKFPSHKFEHRLIIPEINQTIDHPQF